MILCLASGKVGRCSCHHASTCPLFIDTRSFPEPCTAPGHTMHSSSGHNEDGCLSNRSGQDRFAPSPPGGRTVLLLAHPCYAGAPRQPQVLHPFRLVMRQLLQVLRNLVDGSCKVRPLCAKPANRGDGDADWPGRGACSRSITVLANRPAVMFHNYSLSPCYLFGSHCHSSQLR